MGGSCGTRKGPEWGWAGAGAIREAQARVAGGERWDCVLVLQLLFLHLNLGHVELIGKQNQLYFILYVSMIPVALSKSPSGL